MYIKDTEEYKSSANLLNSINMKREFVPYKESLELKELGFDDPCFGFWDGYNGDSHFFFKPRVEYHWLVKLFKDVPDIKTYNQDFLKYYEGCCAVLAPLYTQVFKWFRDRNKIDYPEFDYDEQKWFCHSDYYICKVYYNTYEEAQLKCLQNLIKNFVKK